MNYHVHAHVSHVSLQNVTDPVDVQPAVFLTVLQGAQERLQIMSELRVLNC